VRNSRSPIVTASTDVQVDWTVLRKTPEDNLPPAPAPRVAVAGRLTKWQCSDCHDWHTVVTKTGVAVCRNPVHNEDKPQLPLHPTAHERDGRQPARPEPTRPHALIAS
jgi:hypothetical protein